MSYRQDTRLVRMNTSLGKDRLYVSSFSGREALSSLYRFEVEAFSSGSFVEVAALVGQPIVVSVLASGTDDRHFHGYVRQAEFDRYDYTNDLYHYSIEVVPWLWFLTRRTDCRIFQNKSVIDIATEIFKDFGFTDYEMRTTGAQTPRDYCVQYRENCFDFVSRLFEEEGIFYFFEHTKDRHTLVLADSANAHKPVPVQDSYRHQRAEAGDAAAAVSEWGETVRVRSGRVALGDFNFETPQTDLTVGVGTVNQAPHSGDLELYDYPGNYLQRGEGDRRARTRMEEEEALWRVFFGRSNAPVLWPGASFALTEHAVKAYNSRYTLVSVEHEATNNWEGLIQQGAHYGNRFEAVASGVTFRPPRLTPRPLVEGPQTAMVVGPAGEEIFVDSYGRVKVQFHWDRRGSADEKASCWIRVAQGWAGQQWGVMVPPRVGMEVVVDFLEGDPDRPLVTGCLYNRNAMPPYPLPGDKTRTTIKTRSSPGGGNFNELRFEDKKGAEQIFIHGGRDLDLRVKHDRREWIGASRHLIVNGSQFELAGGSRHSTVRGDHNQKIDGSLSHKIGVDHHEEVGLNYAVKAGMEIALEAGMTLTIKAGGSHITLGPTGVTISGPLVLINSGGPAGTLSASAETARLPAEAGSAAAGDKSRNASRRTLQRSSGNRARTTQIQALRNAAKDGTPFCKVCEEGKGQQQAPAPTSGAGSTAPAPATNGGAPATPGAKTDEKKDDGPQIELKGKGGTEYDGRDYRYYGSETPSGPIQPKLEAKLMVSDGGALHTFGDKDNYVKVGEAKYGAGIGYERNFDDNRNFYGAYLEGQVAGVTAQAKGSGLDGLVEGQAQAEALSAKAAFRAGYEESPTFRGLKGEAGVEANLIKGSASGQVNITPKTIYDNTLGKAVGYVKPGWSKAPGWMDHGVIVGAEVEAGIGAAAKGSAEYNLATNTVRAGGKIGMGPMAGVYAIFGIK